MHVSLTVLTDWRLLKEQLLLLLWFLWEIDRSPINKRPCLRPRSAESLSSSPRSQYEIRCSWRESGFTTHHCQLTRQRQQPCNATQQEMEHIWRLPVKSGTHSLRNCHSQIVAKRSRGLVWRLSRVYAYLRIQPTEMRVERREESCEVEFGVEAGLEPWVTTLPTKVEQTWNRTLKITTNIMTSRERQHGACQTFDRRDWVTVMIMVRTGHHRCSVKTGEKQG